MHARKAPHFSLLAIAIIKLQIQVHRYVFVESMYYCVNLVNAKAGRKYLILSASSFYCIFGIETERFDVILPRSRFQPSAKS